MNSDVPQCFCCRSPEGLAEELMTAVKVGNMYNTRGFISFYGITHFTAKSGGYFLLCEALKRKHKAVAKYLIQEGCAVNVEQSTPDTPLQLAALAGDISTVEMLISKGASVNAKGGKMESTPLCTAVFACKSKLNIIQLLLSAGADVNMADRDGGTPLLIAAGNCSAPVSLIAILRKHGAYDHSVYVKPPSREGFTPLHAAARNRRGGVEVATFLLGVGFAIDAKSADLRTPLHAAIEYGNERLVEFLLLRGADVDAEDRDGKTTLCFALLKNCAGIINCVFKYRPSVCRNPKAFCYAVAYCDEEIIDRMLQYGCTANPQDFHDPKFIKGAVSKGLLKWVDEIFKSSENLEMLRGSKDAVDWCMPLHIASKFKQEATAKLLITLGADVNAKDRKNATPIFYAVRNSDVKMFELLVIHKADVKSYPCLIHIACQQGCVEIVKVLLEHGVDVNAPSRGIPALLSTLLCPLEDSDRCKTVEIAELCVRNGADVNSRGHFGETPLIVACQKGLDSVAKLLVNHHADVNSVDKEGSTALHYSVRSGNMNLSKMLLIHSARVNAKSKNGSTPLHVACENGSKELVELLLEWGADVDAQCQRGTGLHIACLNRNKEIVNVLLKCDADANITNRDGDTPFRCACKITPYGFPHEYEEEFLPYIRSIRRIREYAIRSPRRNDLATHLIKVQAANLDNVNEEDFRKLRTLGCRRSLEGVEMGVSFFAECKEEVEIMKKERIDDSDFFSLYDLLQGTNLSFQPLPDEFLVQSLKWDYFERKFPIYCDMVIDKVMHRKKVKKVVESRRKCKEVLLDTFPGMPDLSAEHILSYLKPHDLIIFLRAICTDSDSSI